MTLFDHFIKDVLLKEGGYSNDPRDSGGETNYGITIATARNYGYTGSMRNMNVSVAKSIYKSMYWDSLRLDDIQTISPEIALKMADIGVNMGIDRAARFCQRTLNVLNNQGKIYPDITVDGKIGNITINTLRKYVSHRGAPGKTVFIRALNCLQGEFYISLSERRQTDEAFVYGWLLNRVD